MGLCGAFQTCSALLLATMVVKQLVFKTTAELGKEREADGASLNMKKVTFLLGCSNFFLINAPLIGPCLVNF